MPASISVKRFFLGVDGGQSSTTALIADEMGRVRGVGRAGPCNHASGEEGRQKLIRALTECLSAASQSAGLDPIPRFASACLGLSGGPADKEALVSRIVGSDKITVTHDAAIALAGALAGQPGVIVIAGTGSIAFGRNVEDRTARAGGWGYVFGDEGGAFHIVRQALRAALRLEEGWGRATSLRAVLLESTSAEDANDLLHRFYTPEFPRPRIAALAKLVDQAAGEGDAAAREILFQSAQALVELAGVVRRQLFRPADATRFSYLGGVFRSRIVRERFFTLLETDPSNCVVAPVHGPAAGALLEAFRVARVPCSLSNVPEEKV
ncbi:MAG TPA: BadF/BadG/BcrA/BcrD ATPase family protein [Bryobacteraceae bacterium]|nr:BadF/BadG/BcrA/BcrD ATPase family protein [Bryobacteraceae bacterium]